MRDCLLASNSAARVPAGPSPATRADDPRRRMELVRARLMGMVASRADLGSPEVQRLSELLDELIDAYLRSPGASAS